MRGFSLVELSIVLVILGLLTGGILAGQSLIKASQLRAVTSEFTRYRTAMYTFRDKYFLLPGDMNNATSFWGTDPDGCPGTNATVTLTAATCNGNGNGQITHDAATSNERFRAWQHLANAGLVEGNYSGVADSTTATDANTTPGWNAPGSKYTTGRWAITPWGDQTIASAAAFEGSYGHILMFGAGGTTAGAVGWPIIGILTPEDAWNIDSKLDDGKPGTGFVTVREDEGPSACHNQTPSTTVAIAAAAVYNLNVTTAACSLQFKTGL